MIEAKPHTPESSFEGPTEIRYVGDFSGARVGRQRLVDDLLKEVHEKYHTSSSELPSQTLKVNEDINHDTAAYLEPASRRAYALYVDPTKVPNIARLTQDSSEEPLQPGVPGRKIERSRVHESIEKDLGVRVTAELLGVQFLGDEQTSNVATGDEKNVSSWVKYTIEGRGDRRNPHLDRRAIKAIGAILDREIIETPKEIEKGIVLEDHTHKKAEQVVVADDDYHLAEEITTGSHKTIDQLDEVIIRDRKKLTHRLQRAGAYLVEKARDHIPTQGSPGQPQPV